MAGLPGREVGTLQGRLLLLRCPEDVSLDRFSFECAGRRTKTAGKQAVSKPESARSQENRSSGPTHRNPIEKWRAVGAGLSTRIRYVPFSVPFLSLGGSFRRG